MAHQRINDGSAPTRRGQAPSTTFVHPSHTLHPGFFETPTANMSSSTTRPIVFMDINIGETPAGRLKMELFSDIVPK